MIACAWNYCANQALPVWEYKVGVRARIRFTRHSLLRCLVPRSVASSPALARSPAPMPDTTIQDALQRAVDHSKKNFKERHVLVSYVLCLIAWVGVLFLLIENAKNGGWVVALYFALVPLLHTVAALTDLHVLHFWVCKSWRNASSSALTNIVVVVVRRVPF
mgnify:FL=1